jgi:hypothetical protein
MRPFSLSQREPRRNSPRVLLDFLCDASRNWRVAERYGEDGRVVLLNPNFDYPVIVQTYDLLTDREVNTILESAGIDPS